MVATGGAVPQQRQPAQGRRPERSADRRTVPLITRGVAAEDRAVRTLYSRDVDL